MGWDVRERGSHCRKLAATVKHCNQKMMVLPWQNRDILPGLCAWVFLLATTLPPLSPSASPGSPTAINIANPWALRAPVPASALFCLPCSPPTPPTTLSLTKCYLWFSRTFHRPFRYSKVLGCCLKCFLEIKTRFLCEAKAQLSSWPQWPSLQQSSALHKSKAKLPKPTHGITLCCSVQRCAQLGSPP